MNDEDKFYSFFYILPVAAGLYLIWALKNPVRRRGAGRQLALPADSGFTNDYSAQSSTSSASASASSSASRTSSSGSDAGRAVQRALRAYAIANARHRGSEYGDNWSTKPALNDGIIGPQTIAAWDVVRNQLNAVWRGTYPAALFQTVMLHHINGYSTPSRLIEAAGRVEAAANDANYWTRLNYLAENYG